jgi:hypothetical protein
MSRIEQADWIASFIEPTGLFDNYDFAEDPVENEYFLSIIEKILDENTETLYKSQ